MLPKAFVTMMLVMMAMAVFTFPEGARIKNDGTTSDRIKATQDAVDQVDALLADPQIRDELAAFEEELTSSPQLQQQLEEMMEDPSLQEQVASIQKQIESMKVESPSSPSLLEKSESSGGQATAAPWKVVAATLLLMDPSFAFRVTGPAMGRTSLARTFPTMQEKGDEVRKAEAGNDQTGYALATTGEESPLYPIQRAYTIFQESREEGVGFKQAVADAIAGDYDRVATTNEVQELASSAPLVMFTWESSPACKQAKRYLYEAGVQPKIIRLDDPWSTGNKQRATLGRLTGQSSVPSIWIGGKYIGGCEDGPNDNAPGLVPLAFRGELYPMLRSAGAIASGEANGASAAAVPPAEEANGASPAPVPPAEEANGASDAAVPPAEESNGANPADVPPVEANGASLAPSTTASKPVASTEAEAAKQ